MAKKVMIVDDEADLCETVKLLLEGRGFEVVTVLSGGEALEKLKKEKVDLALIDFFMPGMTGRDLVDKIRADPKLKDLKLAFLTVASFGKVGLEDLRKLGVLDYIRKPFDNEDLVRRVKKIVGE
ncbi:MAG: response regulator [Candidatus Hadarchaeaceae archaeon]